MASNWISQLENVEFKTMLVNTKLKPAQEFILINVYTYFLLCNWPFSTFTYALFIKKTSF